MYATGSSAAVETTGLAVQALLKCGEGSATARKALAYLAVEEGCSGRLGNHAGHHHGAAGDSAFHRKRRGRYARDGRDHLERQAGAEPDADSG